MGRRIGVAIIGVALLASTWVGMGEAAAARIPVAATGSLQCSVTGTIKYQPPLGAATVPTTTSITAKLGCHGTGSGSNPAVQSGKLVATSTSVGMSCTVRNIAEVNGAITWKAAGSKVVSSSVHLGAEASATTYHFTSSGTTTTGSYPLVPIEVNGGLSSRPCGKHGIKKSAMSGTLDIGQDCDSNVLTTNGFTYDAQDEFFWVVVPFCDYLPQNHPTGTLTVTIPNSPGCTVSGPLVDTGMNAASSAFDPTAKPKPYTYWGVDTGRTWQDLLASCNTSPQTYVYSGDGHYRGYSQP